MIIVNISNTEQVVTTEPVYMWDYGRKLKIVSEVCPLVNEIHFCDRSYENALVRIGTLIEGGLVVTIPDALLENKYEINAFLYVHDGESGKTLKQIKIPVIQRKKPEGFNPLTPTEEQILQDAVEKITAEIDSLSAMYENSMTYNELVQFIQDSQAEETKKPMKTINTTLEFSPGSQSGQLECALVVNNAEFTENNIFVELFSITDISSILANNISARNVVFADGAMTINFVCYSFESSEVIPFKATYWINKNTGQPSCAFVHC